MEIELGGRRYGFSFSFFALLAVYLLLDRYGVGLSCLAAVALHECGHILAMKLCGARIVGMWFFPFGVRIDKRGLLSYGKELWVYAGGPLANLLGIAGALAVFGVNAFAMCNLLLLLFNLLPVGRLDGGVLLRLALCRAGLPEQAARAQKLTGAVFLAFLLAGALYMARRGNLTLLLTTAYLSAELVRDGGNV